MLYTFVYLLTLNACVLLYEPRDTFLFYIITYEKGLFTYFPETMDIFEGTYGYLYTVLLMVLNFFYTFKHNYFYSFSGFYKTSTLKMFL